MRGMSRVKGASAYFKIKKSYYQLYNAVLHERRDTQITLIRISRQHMDHTTEGHGIRSAKHTAFHINARGQEKNGKSCMSDSDWFFMGAEPDFERYFETLHPVMPSWSLGKTIWTPDWKDAQSSTPCLCSEWRCYGDKSRLEREWVFTIHKK